MYVARAKNADKFFFFLLLDDMHCEAHASFYNHYFENNEGQGGAN